MRLRFCVHIRPDGQVCGQMLLKVSFDLKISSFYGRMDEWADRTEF